MIKKIKSFIFSSLVILLLIFSLEPVKAADTDVPEELQ